MTYLTTPTNARDLILEGVLFDDRFVSSAKSVTVSSNSQVFTYDSTGALSPATQYISFIASKANTANNITWTTVPSGINLYAASTGGTSLTGTTTASTIVYLRSADFISTAVFTGSITSSLLSITAVTSGTISIGMTITGGAIPAGCVITALGTGTGGTGTYSVTIPSTTTVSSITITGTKPANSVQVTATIIDSEIVSDTTTILKLQAGFGGISAILSNESHTIPTDSTGANPVLVGSGTNIYLYEGLTQLAYDGIGLAAGTWTVSVNNPDGNVTLGAISDLGTYAQAAALTGMLTSSNTAVITYTITGTSSTGIPIGANSSLIKTQTISKTKQGVTSNSIYTGVVYIQNALYPIGTAPAAPTGGTYNFTTPALTAPTSWTITQPATSTIPTWACEFTFVGTGTVTAGTWTNIHVEAVNGIDGEYRDVIELYSQSTSTKPATAYYNFTNNTISSSNSSVVAVTGWSMTQPTSSTVATYMTKCLAKTSTPGTNVTLTAWTDAVVVAQNGAKGDPGDSVTGATGAQNYRAYIATTNNSTTPGTPSNTTNGAVPTSSASPATGTAWSLSPIALGAVNTTQWQSDGTQAAGQTTTIWSTPYLSYFKVGSLEAITANIGNLTIDNAGSIKNVGGSYGGAGGFFLGYTGGGYKFSIGDKLTYNGSVLSVPAITINANGTLNNAGTGQVSLGGIGYTGDTDATKGAPANTYVGSTLAQNVESNAATGLTNANAAATAAATASAAAALAQTTASGALSAAALAQTTATSALNSAGTKLSKSTADILSSKITIAPNTADAGFVAGTLAWNTSGDRTSGYGVAMTPKGLVGYAANGTNTFAVNASDGSASFTGEVTATSGTFTGAVYANTGTFTGVVTATSGSFTGAVYASSGSFTGAVYASSGSFTGAVTATSGSFTGAVYASSGYLKGSLYGGAYSAYAWPSSAAGVNAGFYLGPEGLLLGNNSLYTSTGTGGYFQVSANGDVTAPSFSITNGNAVFKGNLEAATGSFKGGVYGGDYLPQYGYNWPYANGANNLSGKGFALNSSGLLLGNYFAWAANPTGNIGYVEITQNGTFNAPGLNIANGNAIFSGALSAATGSFKGSVKVGTAEISGTGISGAGAAIYNTGSFAMGGTTSSIVGSGSAIYLNGPVIYTDNIIANEITFSVNFTDAVGITVSSIA